MKEELKRKIGGIIVVITFFFFYIIERIKSFWREIK